MIGKKETSEDREKMTKKKKMYKIEGQNQNMRFREYQGEEDGITA